MNGSFFFGPTDFRVFLRDGFFGGQFKKIFFKDCMANKVNLSNGLFCRFFVFFSSSINKKNHHGLYGRLVKFVKRIV